jgi:hypothetical protein
MLKTQSFNLEDHELVDEIKVVKVMGAACEVSSNVTRLGRHNGPQTCAVKVSQIGYQTVSSRDFLIVNKKVSFQ